MEYQRKTVDVWRLFVDYGCGYEHELDEFSRAEALERVQEYRENCPQFPVRLSKGRIPITEVPWLNRNK